MGKPTNITLKQVATSQTRVQYRTTLKFGGREVSDALVGNIQVDVETADGRRATGTGSMPLSNAWAWPTTVLNDGQALMAMVDFFERVAQLANSYQESGDPLQITLEIGKSYAAIAEQVIQDAGLDEPMPKLAQLVSASPLEAAIHDAFGKALGQNSYNVLGPDFVNHDLSHYLTDEFQGEFLDQYTLRIPQATMPLYHLVGALDPLTIEDIDDRINDSLPETLGEWIAADGLTHLKIKLAGDNLQADVNRVMRIEEIAVQSMTQLHQREWFYSCDFNEKCSNVQYVLDFLKQVQHHSPPAWDRIQYIEQPTHRDLRGNPENRMHEAAQIKPVVIDESLVDLESLMLSRQQGYSGVALKACKGHSEALLMGAAAQKFGLFLCVQDLTCAGASFLHSTSLAARIPTVTAIEGNGRQYCPAGNRGWDILYPGMFEVTDGTVASSELSGNGLGFPAAP